MRLSTIAAISSSFSVVPAVACTFQAEDGTCYGRDMRRRQFFLAEGFTNLNHGSFGAVPRPVRARQDEYFLEQEAYPDTWFRKSHLDYADDSRKGIAGLVGASVDDLVLVENASSAVNSVLRSMGLTRGDKVLRLSTAYGMVVETLEYLTSTVGIEVISAEVTFPVSGPDQMVDAVRLALGRHPDVKLCVFSHISSMPAIVEPLDQLVSAVRALAPSSLIMVDGAHAPGVLNLNIPSYDVDFYLGNCHKWMYAPKGTAFLWVAPARRTKSFPEPTVISSSGKQDFVGRYAYTGTRDYTGFATLGAALDFRVYLGGGDRIYSYCHGLAIEAGRYLADAWGTELLVPEDMLGYMVNIILPSQDGEAVKYMQEHLNSTYSIFLVYGSATDSRLEKPTADGHLPSPNGPLVQDLDGVEIAEVSPTTADPPPRKIFFTRLSAQVYLEMEDFRPLATLVPQLLKQSNTLSID